MGRAINAKFIRPKSNPTPGIKDSNKNRLPSSENFNSFVIALSNHEKKGVPIGVKIIRIVCLKQLQLTVISHWKYIATR